MKRFRRWVVAGFLALAPLQAWALPPIVLPPPTSLPPSGAAGGDLSGTYPNPTVSTIGGVTPATVNANTFAQPQAVMIGGTSTTANLSGLGTGTGSQTVGSTTGWPTGVTFYFIAGDAAEVMSATVTDSTHINVTGRALFGTSAVTHTNASVTIAFYEQWWGQDTLHTPNAVLLSNKGLIVGDTNAHYGGNGGAGPNGNYLLQVYIGSGGISLNGGCGLGQSGNAMSLGCSGGGTSYLYPVTNNAWQLGQPDAASPVAQTLSVQNVVGGTSNTGGANFTIQGSKGTGTGTGGSLIFQVAPASGSSSTQNALATALTIDSTKNATFTGGIVSGGSTPSLSGTCTTGSQTGGATTGKFTATCTAQTVIIALPTAPNGWFCVANDITTTTDTLKQSATSASSCTLTGTTVASDTVLFNAVAY